MDVKLGLCRQGMRDETGYTDEGVMTDRGGVEIGEQGMWNLGVD